jgi:hypothetical protein
LHSVFGVVRRLHWLAFVLALLTVPLFFVDYLLLNGALPGYEWFAYPGIAWLRLFTEEINFWPKFGLLLLGQYLGFFVLATSVLLLRRVWR